MFLCMKIVLSSENLPSTPGQSSASKALIKSKKKWQEKIVVAGLMD